jgi:hypothetical protein
VLVLISSNSSRRYGDDIVRALAHPRGTDFQFRYGLKYFDPALIARTQANKLAGQEALICFLDADKATRTATFSSCRAVTVKRSEIVGSSCILTLTAGDYVKPLSDSELRAKLTASELKLLPAWASNPDFPEGKFVIEVDSKIHAGRVPHVDDELTAFEQTASALSKFPFFAAASRLTFYAVRAIATDDDWRPEWWRQRQRVRAPYKDGRFQLSSGYRYDLEVYTFTPIAGAIAGGATKFLVDSDEKAIRFVSAKQITLDSRYDLNSFTFTTDQFLDTLSAGLRLALSIPTTVEPNTEQRCDITLPVSFGGWRVLGISRMVIIAVGTAAPAIVGIVYKDQMSVGIAAVMIMSALIAGWASVFLGSKKS